MNNKLKTFVIAIAVPLFTVHIGLLSIQDTWEDVELHISPSEITANRFRAASTLSELPIEYGSTPGYMSRICSAKRWRQFE